MAKKFNTNVAEAWISKDINSFNETGTNQEEVKIESVSVPEEIVKEVSKKTVEKKPVEKKSSEKTEKTSRKSKPETLSINIVGKEKKTKLTSFLLTESNYNKLANLAKKNGISVNGCLNQILEQVL